MSKHHVDPVMRDILDALGYSAVNTAACSPLQTVLAADRQMINAYQARLQELEALLYSTHSALEVCRNERNQLRQFCDSFADWEQVLTGQTEPTPIDQDVVIEALKVLRDRHLNELEAIIEPLHRKWLTQFWSE